MTLWSMLSNAETQCCRSSCSIWHTKITAIHAKTLGTHLSRNTSQPAGLELILDRKFTLCKTLKNREDHPSRLIKWFNNNATTTTTFDFVLQAGCSSNSVEEKVQQKRQIREINTESIITKRFDIKCNHCPYLNLRNLALDFTDRTWNAIKNLNLIKDAIQWVPTPVNDVRNLNIYTRMLCIYIIHIHICMTYTLSILTLQMWRGVFRLILQICHLCSFCSFSSFSLVFTYN